MEMPQSGERITGRDRMRVMQESFPGPPPSITIIRVSGAGHSWFLEGLNDYGDGDLWHVVIFMEFSATGLMLRDTRYYAKAFEPPPGAPNSSTLGEGVCRYRRRRRRCCLTASTTWRC